MKLQTLYKLFFLLSHYTCFHLNYNCAFFKPPKNIYFLLCSSENIVCMYQTIEFFSQFLEKHTVKIILCKYYFNKINITLIKVLLYDYSTNLFIFVRLRRLAIISLCKNWITLFESVTKYCPIKLQTNLLMSNVCETVIKLTNKKHKHIQLSKESALVKNTLKIQEMT